jgi:hypothetical protein
MLKELAPYQCCQLLAELSASSVGGEIRPLRKKNRPPGDLHSFKGICALNTKIIFVYVSDKSLIFLVLALELE